MTYKISSEKNFELQNLLIDRIVKSYNGASISDIEDLFLQVRRHFIQSINRQYPLATWHGSQRIARS